MGRKCKKTILQLPDGRLASVSPKKAKQYENFKKVMRKMAKKKEVF